ncbi:hypothetical protein FNV43_RR00804 [Rhamnella rubrinervis]|uniref:RING-type E3 ubiquitin transferase n=1 Tax=Rhamnella rubrinervis TaxID=2594499 RepID=A0A8K0MSA2_9ROSA|nr:hypothetical protein FNV43_RR00804 [Rhamnella rubrinervis]
MELPSSSLISLPSRRSREKLLRRVIWPAVQGQSCPICLEDLDVPSSVVLTACKHAYCAECMHRWSRLRRKCPLCNADFDSWFSHINLSSRNFHKQHLPALSNSSNKLGFDEQHPLRTVINGVRSRTRPLPWRRSFGRPGTVGDDVSAERKLRWRASIYEKRLQAVPSSPQNQKLLGHNGVKERILQRIEPWIRRELQAILGDTDPSIIVHVAASIYISSLEEKVNVSSGQPDMGDNFLPPLQPFLLDRTNMFWHELRDNCGWVCSSVIDSASSQRKDYLKLAIDLLSEFHELHLSKLTDFNGDVKFLRQKSTRLCGLWVMDRRAEQGNFLISWRHGHGVFSFVKSLPNWLPVFAELHSY